MTKASDNPYPSLLFEEHVDPAAPSAGYQRLFIDTDHHLKSIDSSSTVTDWTAAAGAVATDTIWTAAGDIAVATANDAAAVLPIGAAGGALSVINAAVAWNSGTAFPGDKDTGDRYWRTDLGLEFYWDGTRWVSTTLYLTPLAGPFDGSTTAVQNGNPFVTSGGVASRTGLYYALQPYLVAMYADTYVATTNNGSNYWTLALSGAITTTAYGNFTTAADSANTHTRHTATLDAAAGATEGGLLLTPTKTGSPGGVYISAGVSYRLIAT